MKGLSVLEQTSDTSCCSRQKICIFCSFPAYLPLSLVYLLVSQISVFEETEWDKAGSTAYDLFLFLLQKAS